MAHGPELSERQQRGVFVAAIALLAGGFTIALALLPIGMSWRDSLIFGAITFVMAVVEIVMDNSSF